VLSGEDSLLLDCCVHGGRGSICAAALVYPREILRLYRLIADGRVKDASALNRQLRPKVQALFSESNPVPIKHAMSLQHGISSAVRSPLGPAAERTVQAIAALGLGRETGA
jgi:dihydrodipicolinate synthase/N-acetylneuraminate lyase